MSHSAASQPYRLINMLNVINAAHNHARPTNTPTQPVGLASNLAVAALPTRDDLIDEINAVTDLLVMKCPPLFTLWSIFEQGYAKSAFYRDKSLVCQPFSDGPWGGHVVSRQLLTQFGVTMTPSAQGSALTMWFTCPGWQAYASAHAADLHDALGATISGYKRTTTKLTFNLPFWRGLPAKRLEQHMPAFRHHWGDVGAYLKLV